MNGASLLELELNRAKVYEMRIPVIIFFSGMPGMGMM